MRTIIDLDVGAELFQNIGKMIQIRKQQLKLMNELAVSTIHHKAVLSDDADLGISSIIILDEKGLQMLRCAFRVATDLDFRIHALPKMYSGIFADKITTDDNWESFDVVIPVKYGKDQKITLNTQHAKFLIQYLVPKMPLGTSLRVWYTSNKLQRWEMD